MEKFYRHQQLGITLTSQQVTDRLLADWDQAVCEEQMQFDSLQQEAEMQKQVTDLLCAYLRQLPNDEPPVRNVEVAMEAPLVDPESGENFGLPLLGVVDLIVAEEDGPLIADFKTSSRSSPPFEVTHEIQLSCYAYLFRETSGETEAGLEIRSLIKTKRPKIEHHRYGARQPRHFRRLFAVLREYLDALHSGRFNFRPGWACGMCEYRDAGCDAWQA